LTCALWWGMRGRKRDRWLSRNAWCILHQYSPLAPAPTLRWHVKQNTATDRVANSCHHNNASSDDDCKSMGWKGVWRHDGHWDNIFGLCWSKVSWRGKRLVGWLEFNIPFQHKCGYIRDERKRVNSRLGNLLNFLSRLKIKRDQQWLMSAHDEDVRCGLQHTLHVAQGHAPATTQTSLSFNKKCNVSHTSWVSSQQSILEWTKNTLHLSWYLSSHPVHWYACLAAFNPTSFIALHFLSTSQLHFDYQNLVHATSHHLQCKFQSLVALLQFLHLQTHHITFPLLI